MQLEELVNRLQNGNNIFLCGGAGVGKTTLTRQTISAFELQGKKVAKLASTGMAATLIGGQTLHSFFDLGIADSEADLERRGKLIPKSKVLKLIKSMDLVVIDEISMVSADLLDMIWLRLSQSGFSGVVLAVGDFLQLPPVVKSGTICFAYESPSWLRFKFEIVELTHNYRSEDEEFNAVLNSVRNAKVTEAEHCYLHNLIQPLDGDLSNHTILFGTNSSAAKHNKRELERCKGVLYAYDAQSVKKAKNISDQEIEKFFKDSRVAKVLELKVSAPVLFTRNAYNYVNGERGVVEKLEQDSVWVRKMSGSVVRLDRVGLDKTKWEQIKIDGKIESVESTIFSIYQFPITLAYAITIHKSQGMSIANLVVDTTEIFAPSQFYVALSRAVSPKSLILKQPRVNWSKLAFAHPSALEFTAKHYVNST